MIRCHDKNEYIWRMASLAINEDNVLQVGIIALVLVVKYISMKNHE